MSALSQASQVKDLGRDLLRFEFSERELRVLFLIFFGRSDAIRMDRQWLEDRLALRSDKVLLVLRDLTRARVLLRGWEEDGVFELQPNCDCWLDNKGRVRRTELAPRVLLATQATPLESSNAGVEFERALVAVSAVSAAEVCVQTPQSPQNSAERVSPAVASSLPNLGKNRREEVSPNWGRYPSQIGEGRDGPIKTGSPCREPVIPPNLGKGPSTNSNSNVSNVIEKCCTPKECTSNITDSTPGLPNLGKAANAKAVPAVAVPVPVRKGPDFEVWAECEMGKWNAEQWHWFDEAEGLGMFRGYGLPDRFRNFWVKVISERSMDAVGFVVAAIKQDQHTHGKVQDCGATARRLLEKTLGKRL